MCFQPEERGGREETKMAERSRAQAKAGLQAVLMETSMVGSQKGNAM